MKYIGYILIVSSPILGALLSKLYSFVILFFGLISNDDNFTSTALVFSIIGLILVLKDN